MPVDKNGRLNPYSQPERPFENPTRILDEPAPAGPTAAAYVMSVLVDAVEPQGLSW
jgi:hypothetical protein